MSDSPTKEQFAELIEINKSLLQAWTHGPLAKLAVTNKGDLLTPERQAAPFKLLPFGTPQTLAVDNDEPVYFGINVDGWQSTAIVPAKDYDRQINFIQVNPQTASRIFLFQKRSLPNATTEPAVSTTAGNWTTGAVPIPGLIAVGGEAAATSSWQKYFSNGSMELAAGEAVFAFAPASVTIVGYMTFSRVDK